MLAWEGECATDVEPIEKIEVKEESLAKIEKAASLEGITEPESDEEEYSPDAGEALFLEGNPI